MAELFEKIGQMLIVGFQGKSSKDASVKDFAKQVEQGFAGGTILFNYNVESPEQVKALAQFFKKSAKLPFFISIDQEGGRVQRLNSGNGFTTYPSAQSIAGMTESDAADWYHKLASELHTHDINFDFAPCVDVNPPGYKCPVIGDLQRSYSSDPGKVVKYAGTMIDALKNNKVVNCIKHFPGHGSAQGDSHEGYVDVTENWDEKELIPFYELAKQGKIDSVMTAHIYNKNLDPEHPATLSKKTLDKLRHAGFDGVIITDDLHMGAIQQHYKYEEALINSVLAGCDMVIVSNNKAAAMGVDGFEPDPNIGEKSVNILVNAVKKGIVPESRIDEAYDRIMNLKKSMA
tara:strand:- start:2602 stop:3636 length:1035 start_codon:yes stop_codon:yes gene_type:complete